MDVNWIFSKYSTNRKISRIDGYGRFETFLKVFIPVSKNGILVAAVISFISE